MFLSVSLSKPRIIMLIDVDTKVKGKKYKIILAITASQSVALIRGQASFLSNNGFDVYLMAPDDSNSREYCFKEGCTLLPVPYSREINLFNDLRSLWVTYRHMRTVRPDLINVGTPKAGLLGVIAGFLAGVKIRIFTLRGIRSTAMSRSPQKTIVTLMEKVTNRLATKVISISPSMAKYAIKKDLLSKDKVVVLARASSNGINLERFSISKKKEAQVQDLMDEFELKEDDFVIGYVGRVVKSKGIEEIFKAFLELRGGQGYSNIKLLVIGSVETVGDAPDPEIIREMQEDDDVIMAGRRDDVEYCYHTMDVFILASHNFREGFGNVAMEAAASGKPVIVSNKGGCQDAVIDGKTGTLVNPFMQTDLVASIQNYIENPETAKEHGLEGAEFAHKYFKNQDIWNAQVSLYRSEIEKNNLIR